MFQEGGELTTRRGKGFAKAMKTDRDVTDQTLQMRLTVWGACGEGPIVNWEK